ncbi:NAD(P)-binding protein [Boletus reticuloceps]|uniref:NAD(P)-binding protein n=1 Tax=Boletus reticuloceps TaxID=495285 RepID=A0A8I2YKL4_9AGAM|nr:NAD(P)-binding protein [Boletus reticuloceps]
MAVFSFFQYLREQWRALPQPRAVDNVSSKTFLVTGSNVGLGFEASVHLAKMRPKLLIATSRNQVKCELARKSILERAVEPNMDLYTWPLELGSFQNVRSFADRFAMEGNGTLNTLVANAGVFPNDYIRTQDDWEIMLQVNYLSTALLSILLLPYLINSSSPDSPSRLVFVSSFAHYFAPELKASDSRNSILETINQPNLATLALLGIMFIRELASRLPESIPFVACAVNPGLCHSEITRSTFSKGWFSSMIKRLALVRSTEEGSRTLVHAAVASDRSMHGRYLSGCEVAEEGDYLFTPEGKACSAKIWDETITLLSGIDGRVLEIVEKYLRPLIHD